jgi:mannose-6-phosphate isomerase
MHDTVLVLDNPVQNYAWGSRTAIAEFLGRPSPAARPEAELWIGAHPKAPSRVVDPKGLGSLDDVIRRDPVAVLGRRVCDRFGEELPFLFKVLAAAEPLSIQAHPSQLQARAGWQRENETGVPVDAPHRNYRDPNHKPELVCALTPFVALQGFRAAADIVRNLRGLAIAQVAEALDRLAHEPGPAALRAVFAGLLTLDAEEMRPVLRRAATVTMRPGDRAWAWVGKLLERYPGDIGALAPLYLNLVTLSPGEALYLPAGELHAYLEGTALEIMANSDNVLRGGLTPKHVDVQELLGTLVFESRAPQVLEAVATAPGERVYHTPAREFELAVLEARPDRAFVAEFRQEVEVLLGLEGNAVLVAGDARWPLDRGRSVLVAAALATYRIEGQGKVARARVPI